MRVEIGEDQRLSGRLREAGAQEASRPLARSSPAHPGLMEALETGIHAIALFDGEDRLVYSNEAFRTGWAVHDPAGATFASLIRHCHLCREGAVIDTADLDEWLAHANHRRRQGARDRCFEVDLWDGRWMWVTERRAEDGCILMIGQDITALKVNERRLTQARDAAVQASLTDPLTGLPNRKSAMEFLDACVTRGVSFHLAIVDIDQFRTINDRFGHEAGDAALVLLSSDLLALKRSAYFPARLSGDEFLIIGSQHESHAAFEANLNRLLRARVKQCARCEPAQVFAISIGAASFPTSGLVVKDLLAAAVRAMDLARSQGRATLRFAS